MTERGGDLGADQCGHHGAAGHASSSAAGHLEPYGIQVMLQPASDNLDPQEFLVALLQDLAAACLASGASLIGHIKCLLHAPSHVVSCNLTSLREGARCSVRRSPGAAAASGAAADAAASATAAPMASKPGQEVWLDLTVLVYGLPAATTDVLVRAALCRLLEPLGFAWSASGAGPEGH